MPFVYQIRQETRQLNSYHFAGGDMPNRQFGSTSVGGVWDYGPVHITVEVLERAEIRNNRRQGWEGHEGKAARPTFLMGTVIPVFVGPRNTPDPESEWPMQKGQDRGHVMALQLGGPNDPANIVPMWAHWQRHEEWRQMERVVYRKACECFNHSKSNPMDKKFVRFRVVINYSELRTQDGTFTQEPSERAWCYPKKFSVKAHFCNELTVKIPGWDLREGDTWLDFEGYPDNF